jgi:hypothetical protein
MFSPYKALEILNRQSGLNNTTLSDEYQLAHIKTLGRLLANPNHGVRDEASFIRLMDEQGVIPFSSEWTAVVTDLLELRKQRKRNEIKRRYGLLFRFTAKALERGEIDSAEDRNGALYFCAHYALETIKESSERKEQAERFFVEIVVAMKTVGTMAAQSLAAQAVGNLVVTKWNATPPEYRASQEMRDYVERFKYFEWLSEEAHFFPKLETPRFNRLAFASRFGMRDRYAEFHAALCEVNSEYANPALFDTAKAEYNDFGDFRQWVEGQRKPLVDSSKKGSRTKKLVLWIGLAIIAGLGLLTWHDQNRVQVADLRPHGQASIDLQPHTMIAIDLRPHLPTMDFG